jgi:hypothetical protein
VGREEWSDQPDADSPISNISAARDDTGRLAATRL